MAWRERNDERPSMQIRFLGNLDATVDDHPIALGGAKQRAVFAMLGLEANRTVAAGRLIEGLWGERPPASAAKMVQTYVWRLRKALLADGGAEILTHGRGYELRIDPEVIDLHRAERLVAEAGRASAAREPSDAAREALALFGGEPLADLADEPFAVAEIRRLEDLRQTAAELAVDADLSAGRHREVVAEIEALLAQNPLREQLHGQRMLALYRCGRQAEALDAYRQARRTLVEEIGVEPGPELRHLQEAILRQDPALDVEPAAAELPRELDATASPPLIGRDGELRRLRAHWRRAAAGAGALVTVVGAYGVGKTRIGAAIAADAHGEGAPVLYACGSGPPEAMLAALARVRAARRTTLLVLDDVDRAPADVRAALRDLAPALVELPALVLASGQEAAALARLQPQDSITLAPLAAQAVRDIARLYAPRGRLDPIPVERLVAMSQGVARRVHEAAGEWARREATRRVDALAVRAAAGRSEARALEAELAGTVVDLQSTRERARRVAGDTEAAAEPIACPYKGLAPFDGDDAEYFFGRERLVAELVARLVGTSLLAVVGPSGSGKSSVVRAGVLPALAGGVLPGSDTWEHVLIRPGRRPMRELCRARERLSGERRGVIAVDQFEELFTACGDEEERREFAAALVDATQSGLAVLALRADFYGRCAAYPDLSRLVGANTVLVGAMSREELRRAIERPAQRVGLNLEPELVDALQMDVEGQPGALPLLSTALLELWRQRDGRRLRLVTYARSGGVQGAVARLAEDAFVQLEPSRQAVARRVLLRLAGEGQGGAIVRRRIGLAELDVPSNRAVADVIDLLTNRRLLTVSEGAVEVAHEALLREWPRLRGWLDEDVSDRRLHRQLSDAARVWDADGRDASELYRGARLSAALEWRAGHDDELNATERAFLDAAGTAAERAQRRLRMVLAAMAALLAVAAVGGVVALGQRASARDEARVAEAQRLGAQALTEPRLDRSLLLARQGVALDDSLATRSNLLEALLRSPAAIRVMPGGGHPLEALDLSPDGRTLAVGDNLGNVVFRDAATGRSAGRPYKALFPITAVKFSPDGARLAVVSVSFIDILDARTHEYARRLSGSPVHASSLVSFPLVLESVAFSPDSRVLAADAIRQASVNLGEPSGSVGMDESPGDTDLLRWDVRTGRRLGRPRQLARRPEPALVGFTGAELVTSSAAERATVVRDAGTLRALRRLRGGGARSALSPDGRVVALGAADGSVRLLDLRTGRLRVTTDRHDGAVTDLRFTPDSRTLLTAGADGRVIRWNVADARRVETFTGHASTVSRVAIAPDGRTAYSAGQDGTVIAWDLVGDRRLDRPFSAPPRTALSIPVVARGSNPADLAPEGASLPYAGLELATPASGATFAVPDDAGYVDVYDSVTLRRTRRIPVNPGTQVSSVALAPDGRTLAATTADGHLRFADLRGRGRLGPLEQIQKGATWSVAFSGDGRWLATVGLHRPSSLRLWDVRTQKIVSTSDVPPYFLAADVAFSPDGTKLAAAVDDPEGARSAIQVLSVPRLEPLETLHATPGRSLQFSHDGHLLVFGDEQGRVWRYDTRTWRPRGRPLAAHNGPVITVELSPDGRMLASTSDDGTTRLWDVASGRPIGAPLPGLARHDAAAAFVDHGTHLVTLHDNGHGYLWDIRPAVWAQRACDVAGRAFTHAEWDDLLPERKYAPACAGSRTAVAPTRR